jgi:hypothetical protein
MKIKNAVENTSDHLALIISVGMNMNANVTGINREARIEPSRSANINWTNEKSVEKYEIKINEKLRKIKFNNIFEESEGTEKKIDE